MWNEIKKFIKDSGDSALIAVSVLIISFTLLPLAIIGYILLAIGKLLVIPYELIFEALKKQFNEK